MKIHRCDRLKGPAIVLALLLLASSLCLNAFAETSWVEITREIILRSGPGFDAARVEVAQPGAKYEYVGEDGGWYQIVTASGITAYVPTGFGTVVGGSAGEDQNGAEKNGPVNQEEANPVWSYDGAGHLDYLGFRFTLPGAFDVLDLEESYGSTVSFYPSPDDAYASVYFETTDRQGKEYTLEKLEDSFDSIEERNRELMGSSFKLLEAGMTHAGSLLIMTYYYESGDPKELTRCAYVAYVFSQASNDLCMIGVYVDREDFGQIDYLQALGDLIDSAAAAAE